MLRLCKLPGLEETREEEGGQNGRRVGGRGQRAGFGHHYICLPTHSSRCGWESCTTVFRMIDSRDAVSQPGTSVYSIHTHQSSTSVIHISHTSDVVNHEPHSCLYMLLL